MSGFFFTLFNDICTHNMCIVFHPNARVLVNHSFGNQSLVSGQTKNCFSFQNNLAIDIDFKILCLLQHCVDSVICVLYFNHENITFYGEILATLCARGDRGNADLELNSFSGGLNRLWQLLLT